MQDNLLRLSDGRYFLDEEQSKIYGQILEARPHYSSEYKWDEMSMADLFADCYKHNTLYCPEMKSWYTYDGSVWVKDTGNVVANDRLKEFVKLLNLYASQLESVDVDIKRYQDFVRRLFDRRARDRILKDAQSEACVYLRQFDSNPYYINCENGTYDLQKDEFHFHRAEDYLTLKTNCVYMTENIRYYKCDRFFQFLNEIMENDYEKLDYLQRALGYSLVGLTTEECMFFAYGKTTRNGKGTLFNTIQTILGDYATTVSSQLICKGNIKDVNTPNPAICALKGKRFVIMSEVEEKERLDEKIIKSYTGGDYISTRALYGEQFNLQLQCKIWLQCNALPKVKDKSLFSGDRAKVIEFNRHFDDTQRDITLKQQFLTKEAKAVIFMWLLDGYKKYVKDKLKEPLVIKKAIKSYETKYDIVKVFIDECCEIDTNSTIVRNILFENFESWRKRGDYEYVGRQDFYFQFSNYFETTTIDGYVYYKGVKLK